MTTLLDTNVLIALLNEDEIYHPWAVEVLNARKAVGPILITDIVYCEFSVAIPTREEVDEAIRKLALERLPWTNDMLFLAGKAYKEYKGKDGNKTNVLPDFLIGAASKVSNFPLITANAKDFVGYFPNLEIIKP